MKHQDLLTDFSNYLTIRGLGQYNRNYARPFLKYCEDNNIDPLKVTYHDISGFLLQLKSRNLDNGSINSYVKAMKSFYTFLCDSGLKLVEQETKDLVCSFKQLPVDIKVKQYLTIKELNGIISQAITYSPNMSPDKIKALLNFMYYTGFRKKEVAQLARKDIDLSERIAVIRRRKNREDLIGFFPREVATILELYFLTEQEDGSAFNMTQCQINHFFKFLKMLMPSGKNIFPHMLRHSFAHMLVKKGVDSRVAQKLLGHKNIQSTLVYYNPDTDEVQNIYRKKIG